MKAVMYHYIRNKKRSFPYSNVLEKKSFLNQVKKFSKSGLVNSHEELFSNNDKYILTFDDGFKDHIYAAEKIKKKGGIGIFFIPTLPLVSHQILDVHKTHLITSKVKASEIFRILNNYIKINGIKNFYNMNEKEKYKNTYKNQRDEKLKKRFKKLMNYYGNLKIRGDILNFLLNEFEIFVKAKDFYLSKNEIKYISSLGMVIGSHSHSHTLLSRLSFKKQFNEIKSSKMLLQSILRKEVNIFCYPYGGRRSYNNNTLNILKKLNFKLAYSVEHKDISINKIKKNPLELPRYDCNIF